MSKVRVKISVDSDQRASVRVTANTALRGSMGILPPSTTIKPGESAIMELMNAYWLEIVEVDGK